MISEKLQIYKDKILPLWKDRGLKVTKEMIEFFPEKYREKDGSVEFTINEIEGLIEKDLSFLKP